MSSAPRPRDALAAALALAGLLSGPAGAQAAAEGEWQVGLLGGAAVTAADGESPPADSAANGGAAKKRRRRAKPRPGTARTKRARSSTRGK